jgi:HD-GYP domain-containing protein (c-di-GMP phosphodiesterase class II)
VSPASIVPADSQVWFYEGSAVASLVEPLREHYVLRPLPPSEDNGAKRAILSAPSKENSAIVIIASAEQDELQQLLRLADELSRGARIPRAQVIGLVDDSQGSTLADDPRVFAYLPRRAGPVLLERTVAAAFENIELLRREQALREELARTRQEMEELNRIGIALSAERDINALLEMVLLKAREITRADAGSLYLVETDDAGQPRLRFRLAQNDSLHFPFTEFTMPMTDQSMAGYVALHGQHLNLADAYQIPEDRPYRFNPEFDQKTGYRTKSVLTVPLKSPRGETHGVLQLINAKRNWEARLVSQAEVDREVVPFTLREERLVMSLVSQAAVAYENNRLYADIERLFEGFVQASVFAIEQRDPTTSGHSFRVSILTVGLAEAADRAETGPFRAVRFTPEQMKEIRYAALLHDFGKVGVREQVLVKAKKLYPAQLDLLQQRFDYVHKALEAQILQEKVRCLLEEDREEARKHLEKLDAELLQRIRQLDDYFAFVLRSNEPTVLPEGNFDRLAEIAQFCYKDPRGVTRPLLTSDEVRMLSIPRGTLDPDERKEIESHVIHTYNFLAQIPWTREIRSIPEIARAHHEFLNGTGYPYRLTANEIPLQTKMMTVCDIFDALSAADRPYKKAVPIPRAIQILEMMVRDGQLDADLFRLFLEAKIYELTLKYRQTQD